MAIWAKNPYFWPPGGQKGVKMNFREKSENVMFLHSLRLCYMQKNRKLYSAVYRENIVRETERQSRTRVQGSSSYAVGPKKANRHLILLSFLKSVQLEQVQWALDLPHQPDGAQHGAILDHPVGFSVVEQSALYWLPQRPRLLPLRIGGPHFCTFVDGTEAEAGFPEKW